MIQYSGGTNINATLTQVAGTRAELVDWIKDELVAAGWTLAVTATHDFKLNSAITPQGLQMRARVYDPGSGNCARVKISNVSESKIQVGDFFLLPAVAKVWRIITNQYQAFIFTPGTTGAREFCCFGTPYVPTLSTPITECLWGHANSSTDTDANNYSSFRTRMTCDNAGVSSGPNFYQLCNGSIVEANNSGSGSSSNPGRQRIITTASGGGGTQDVASGLSWNDDAQFVIDPIIAWGIAAATDNAKAKGQLWDAVVLADAWAGDSTIAYDGKTFFAITANNVGSAGGFARGTLFIVVP